MRLEEFKMTLLLAGFSQTINAYDGQHMVFLKPNLQIVFLGLMNGTKWSVRYHLFDYHLGKYNKFTKRFYEMEDVLLFLHDLEEL